VAVGASPARDRATNKVEALLDGPVVVSAPVRVSGAVLAVVAANARADT
jgi:hypothetical protein